MTSKLTIASVSILFLLPYQPQIVITQYNIPLHKGIHLCLINDMVLLKEMQMEYSQSAVSMATISNMATISKQQYLGHIFSNI